MAEAEQQFEMREIFTPILTTISHLLWEEFVMVLAAVFPILLGVMAWLRVVTCNTKRVGDECVLPKIKCAMKCTDDCRYKGALWKCWLDDLTKWSGDGTEVTCGDGTEVTCGDGTRLVGDECVATKCAMACTPDCLSAPVLQDCLLE